MRSTKFRIRTTLLAAVLATLFGVIATPATASAAPPVTCDGNQHLARDYVYALNGGTLPWGSVDLCWDGGRAYTIFIHFDSSGRPAVMPANFRANGWVYRYDPWPTSQGASSCDGPLGNGTVVAGQTWCRSHRIFPLSDRTVFRGAAFVEQKIGGVWKHVASGWTAPA